MSDVVPQRTSFSRLRRWAIGLNVAVSAVALLAIIVMGNYLAGRHYTRRQWAGNSRAELSPLTRQVLTSLTNSVKITVLFDPEESSLFADVRSLLAEYQWACSRLQVEYVNYGSNPGRATFLMGQYALGSATDTLLIVFEVAGRPPRVVRERELSDYDLEGAMQGQPVRRTGFKGEQFFTSALLAVVDPRPLVAGYVTGHGEPDLDQEDAPDGYHRFALLLAERNIELRPFSLRTNGVPEACQLLVIAGPRTPIPDEELQRIEQYLRGGGRALFFLPSPVRTDVRRSGLGRLLANWNVDLGDDLVIDRSQSVSGDTTTILTGQFGRHPVVQPLVGSRLGLYMPGSVRVRSARNRTGDDGRGEELVFTSREGMTVSEVRGGAGVVQTNGVIPLAVAVEKGAITGVTPDRGAARLVVVGESRFLGNNLIDFFEANRDFAALAANWLLDRHQLVRIGARPIQEYRISLTQSQMRGASWVLLGAMPGTMVLLGLMVWLRRRK